MIPYLTLANLRRHLAFPCLRLAYMRRPWLNLCLRLANMKRHLVFPCLNCLTWESWLLLCLRLVCMKRQLLAACRRSGVSNEYTGPWSQAVWMAVMYYTQVAGVNCGDNANLPWPIQMYAAQLPCQYLCGSTATSRRVNTGTLLFALFLFFLHKSITGSRT